MVLHQPFSPSLLIEQLVKEEITFTLLVPVVVNMLLKYREALNELDLSNLRMIGIGGSPPLSLVCSRTEKALGYRIC